MPTPQPTWITETIEPLPMLLTTAEAARALRMSTRNLRRLYNAGRIKTVRSCETGSSRVLVPRAAIAAYLRTLEGAA